jgi:hypothetical protein
MTQKPFIDNLLRHYSPDPVVRAQAALRRAERIGMARKMEPLERALADADALGIQFYGKQLDDYMQVVGQVTNLVAALEAPTPGKDVRLLPPQSVPTPGSQVPAYLISSATLAEAFAYLTKEVPGAEEQPEWMLGVTGILVDGKRTLERLLDIPLDIQSWARASFNMQEFARVLILLDAMGLALHSIFHSHRFAGKPRPSQTDWRLQEILDQGGYPAIQAVFSEDGYIRFFARRPFHITVSGKGVECVDQASSLYRLVQFDTLPNPGPTPAPRRESVALRPLSAHSGR